MALKKIPANLSYAAIRHKHPPKQSERPAPQPVEDENADEPGEIPDVPQEDRKAAPADDGGPVAETPAMPDQEDALLDVATEPERTSAPKQLAKTNAAACKSIRVRGYVRVPSVGGHDAYDELVEIYGEKEALRLSLSLGMTAYESALRDGKGLEPAPRSNRREKRVEASRSMPGELYAKAVEHIDPKGLFGKSQIGSRILDVALVYYLGKR